MYELNLSSKGKKNRQTEMYDLSRDRRDFSRRETVTFLPSDQPKVEQRHRERRTDSRPLKGFPFLP
ncbi:MAG: hypothetical protein ACJAWS_002009 [Oleiphilaceae bacterium]|jgi:hypothetical protein